MINYENKISEKSLNELKSISITERAERFATIAHSDQLRDDGSPYINHPRRVVETLYQNGISEEDIISAAWLHDAVEDTSYAIENIEYFFNKNIANIVESLTLHLPRYPKDFSHHFRSELKMLALKGKTFSMQPGAKLIKIADRMDNMRSAWDSWHSDRVSRYAVQAQGLFEAIERTTLVTDDYATEISDLLKKAKEIADSLS